MKVLHTNGKREFISIGFAISIKNKVLQLNTQPYTCIRKTNLLKEARELLLLL